MYFFDWLGAFNLTVLAHVSQSFDTPMVNITVPPTNCGSRFFFSPGLRTRSVFLEVVG